MSEELIEYIRSTNGAEKKEEQKCAEAYMDGFKYAIQILQSAVIDKEKAE